MPLSDFFFPLTGRSFLPSLLEAAFPRLSLTFRLLTFLSDPSADKTMNLTTARLLGEFLIEAHLECDELTDVAALQASGPETVTFVRIRFLPTTLSTSCHRRSPRR